MSTTRAYAQSLYDLEAVRRAADAYVEAEAAVAIEVSVEGPDIVARFVDPDPGYGDELFDAFGNHALFETIAARRGGAPGLS